jgi:hypothetical protein
MKFDVENTRFYLVISLVIALLTGGGIYLMVSNAESSEGSVRNEVPKTLVGTWYQTNKLDSGVMMQAQVYRNGTIQVDMRSNDGSHSHYWMGSFPSHRNPNVNFKTTSKADPDAQKVLKASIFGSQDTSKRFNYKRGDLSFKFTMMGTTSTIHLRQPYKMSASSKPSPKVKTAPPAKPRPTATKTKTPTKTVTK